MSQSDKKPDLETLVRYARGDENIKRKWADYMNTHPETMKIAQALARMGDLIDVLDLHRLLPASKNIAGAIFDSFQAGIEQAGNMVANLYYDSREVPLPEGIRPSLNSERRLKYMAGSTDIELSIVPVFPGGFDITGRLEGGGAGFGDKINLRGRRTYGSQMDEYGFFTFSNINPGSYRLSLSAGKDWIVIDKLELR